jgi:putative transposase
VLREHEAGTKTADLARKHGVSEGTLYNWKAKCGGMDVPEAKRLKQEDERGKLKGLLAEQMLDAAAVPIANSISLAVDRASGDALAG